MDKNACFRSPRFINVLRDSINCNGDILIGGFGCRVCRRLGIFPDRSCICISRQDIEKFRKIL